MDTIEVSVTVTTETVRAMVADEADQEEPLPLDWALLLVRRMADRWGVAGGVWFEIDRPRRRFRR